MHPRAPMILRMLEAGLADMALQSCADLVAADPDDPQGRLLAAGVALRLGRVTEAEGHLAAGLAVASDDPALRVERAGLALRSDRPAEAVTDLRVAAQGLPDHPAVLAMLGEALWRAGENPDEAEAILRRARALVPDAPGPAHNLGRLLLHERKSPQEALPHLEVAAALAPHSPDVLADLAAALRKAGRPAEAVPLLERAAKAAPDRPDLGDALGGALLAAERPHAAVACYRRGTEGFPQRAQSWANLSAALIDACAPVEAVAAADRALALAPDDLAARANRAVALMHLGRYADAGADFDSRWALPEFRESYAPVAAAAWDGRPMAGGTLLVRCEQGLGDQVLAARYLPLLKARSGAGSVVVEAHPLMHRLLRPLSGVDRLLPMGATPPVAEAWVGAMSLGWRVGGADGGPFTGPDPAAVPYLRPPDDGPALPAPSRSGTTARVGIVWGTKPRPRERSCPLVPLVAALRRPGVQLYSLQVGPRQEERAEKGLAGEIIDLAPQVTDLADTAALMARLDLVVTVDTSVANLAGALGLPAWVLLLASPDWRWGMTEKRTPWFPTLRLFRQPEPGAWAPVMEAVACAIDEELQK